jgi:membrane protease YdiL (CAAX protease family)
MNRINRPYWTPETYYAGQESPMPPLPQSALHDVSKATAPQGRRTLRFFVLVFALSVPLWILGALTGLQLTAGLPISSLMTFCPLVAALVLSFRENKTGGMKELMKRTFEYRRIRPKVWYAPIVLLMPGVMALSYGLMRLPFPSLQVPGPAAPVMFLAFFVAAAGEEVGWSGYAIDRMQGRWSALQAGILLGLVWAAWHIVPFVQAHRSPAWIAWQCLCLVASRVLITWIYNNTGRSVSATILHHVLINVVSVFFPTIGLQYDPRTTGLIITVAAAVVTVVWGPRTLTRRAEMYESRQESKNGRQSVCPQDTPAGKLTASQVYLTGICCHFTDEGV